MKRVKVFISSVQSEFAKEREMLCHYIRTDALLGKFFEPFIFEEVPANELSANHVYLKEVELCDIYLGLLGNQYGYEDEQGISPTEREYDLAAELHKSRLIFIKSIDEDARHPKEKAFIRKVEQDIVRKTFVDAEGLRTSVYASLVRYMEEKEYIRSRPFDLSYDSGATIEDLDEDKMRNFVYMARSKRNFPLPTDISPTALLSHMDLIDEKNRVSNAAILLFGKKPQKYFITSEVKCVQFYGNEVEKPMPAYQIYRGDVFELVDQATSFVMSRIDNWVGTREHGKSASVPTRPELPIDAVREAIVNAVCHRDYTSNASVQVMLFRNRLEISNPGQLPYGLTVKKLFGPHNSLPPNPQIAEPMYWAGYIEKLGTGTEDIIRKCKDYGLRTPEFYQEEDFRVVIWKAEDLERSKSDPKSLSGDPNSRKAEVNINNSKSGNNNRDLEHSQSDPNKQNTDPNKAKSDPNEQKVDPKDEKRLIELLKLDPSISRAKLSKQLGISERQIRKIIDSLRSKEKLYRENGNRGRWIVVGKGKKL